MRTSRSVRKARRRTQAAPPITHYTFQCTCCEIVEHRSTPALPVGWETEQLRGDIYAYCPDCGIDLPRGHIQ